MTGTWERLADAPFALDPQIEAEVYRWHAPGQAGLCSIEFQAPKEAPHRRFYPVEVLEALQRQEPADDYVERMCRVGITLLPVLESVMPQQVQAADSGEEYAGNGLPPPATLEFLLDVFVSRRAGRQRVKRAFHREDDFYATEGSRKDGTFLIPGVEPPQRPSKSRPTSQEIIVHIADYLADHRTPAGRDELELSLSLSPLRSAIDQVLVEGVFRRGEAGKARTINDIANLIAPALIDGIEVGDDGRFIGDHPEEFRHFVQRLHQRWRKDRDGFQDWLDQERQKGFKRILPGFQKLSGSDREEAKRKGTRFYRHTLWASYEAMSRCFGVTALHQWVSFFQSDVTRPSPAEQRAFRCYNAPLVLAAGMPLWFFGPNVLRWVLTRFIDLVWEWKDGQDFDVLTDVIAVYGQAARERRRVDTDKKRRGKVARNSSDLLAGTQDVQFTEGSDGKTLVNRTRTVSPVEPLSDRDVIHPDLPESGACDCGGRLVQLGDHRYTDSWIVVDTECVACGREQTYQRALPDL